MSGHGAFVCYTHADDDADRGRILQLAKDIATEYSTITGEVFSINYDQISLKWGDDWREMLTRLIGDATFLIPIITPRFFLSDECRRELLSFQQIAEQLSRSQLVLPILYVEVPDLNSADTDSARQLIAKSQYEDWTHLRFEELTSFKYRTGLNNLAKALHQRVLALPDAQPTTTRPGSTVGVLDDSDHSDELPGMLDAIAEGEGPVEEMTDAMLNIARLSDTAGELMSESNARFNKSSDANAMQLLANRIVVAGELAKGLSPVVDDIEFEVKRFRSALDKAVPLVEALLTLGTMPDNRDSSRKLANTLISNAPVFTGLFEVSDGLIASLLGIEGLSKSLRGPTQRLRGALQNLRDTQPTIVVWADDAEDFLQRLSEMELSSNPT